ncbi:pseudaminic acid biosynthesis-associated methylase [Polynucleobacter sp. AM-7D1]|uniref:pseudaminic acid biosynthesis-associated methylase n=1 Tax=Polynucleobacter sp. AM-7D1 TaxID=2689102 RepID=UPI001BFCFF87|nr:pseudaminic acid biosynthesis-associated methylase [Polynucleobacter sp. AM-7D1]QWE28986.1 pseudaminic acid biosynthesis-associated methylase [Polynucleobacter sp. AM-7D1]
MFKTEQEEFWAGEFGREYIERNQDEAYLLSNINFFSKALAKVGEFKDMIEFGPNIGMNMRAIQKIFPGDNARFNAVEINSQAVQQLKEHFPSENIYEKSILDWVPQKTWDLVLIKGVLIHINPDHLADVYMKLVQATAKYLLIAEYYNPTPVEVKYHDQHDRLFKRDFAGELMDSFENMNLVDYGFVYRRDPQFPQDDITWFLLEKTKCN